MPEQRTSILAVVVAYEKPAQVRECVRSLRKHVDDVSAIVVVDNSQNRDIESLCAEFSAGYVAPEVNLGYGQAVNLGVEHGGTLATHILVVNPDLVLTQVRPILDAANSRQAALVTAYVTRSDGTVDTNSRRFPTLRREFLSAVLGTRIYRARVQRLDGGIDRIEQASGALLLTSRETWVRLGGFDAQFELYYEDVDLSKRAGRLGDVLCVRLISGQHLGGQSYETNRSEAYIALRVSRVRYLRKWRGRYGVVGAMFIGLAELAARSVTRQPEGIRTRWAAVKVQLQEVVFPDTVKVLT